MLKQLSERLIILLKIITSSEPDNLILFLTAIFHCLCVCVCVCERKKVRECVLSRVPLFATPWTAASRAPLSMGFPRQEYWNPVAISYSRGSSPPRDQTLSLGSPVLAGRFFTPVPPSMFFIIYQS